jgi:hypothetical protein
MAFVVSCPSCERKLLLPDGCGGMSVRCPSCSKRFTAPASASEEARKDEPLEVVAITLEPRRSALPPKPVPEGLLPDILREARLPWEQLHTGLRWILIGTCIELAMTAMRFLGVFYLPAGRALLDVLMVGWCATSMVGILGDSCTVAGLFICVLSPHGGMRRWIGFTALGVTLVFLLPAAGGGFAFRERWTRWLGLLVLVIPIGSYVGKGFLVFFIREVGRSLRDRRTLSRFRWLVPIYVCAFLFTLVALSIMTDWFDFFFPFRPRLYSIEELVFHGAFALTLLLGIQQIRLLLAARLAVQEHLETFGPSPEDPD